ncbi:MAG: SMI1/KNR4 family protein [Ruminococcus flavefaciens]|nr:SMI1/KNR4 family protein [Ruminococcus flavefaciens]
MNERLDRIKAKLIYNLGKCNEKYYKRNDRLSLNPPLSMEKIHEFESRYNIRLPAELVAFYTQIADGAWIVTPLNYEENKLYSFDEWIFDKDLISRDFEVEKEMVYDEFDEILNNGGNFDFLYCGTVELMDLGCAENYKIVVNGRHYGEIFADCEMWLPFTGMNLLDMIENALDGNDEFIA